MYSFSYLDTVPWLILIIVVLSVCWGKAPETKKAKVIFFLLFIFCALRYGVGYDYFSYQEGCLGLWPDYSYKALEPVARYLMLSCGKIHYQLFFVITSFLCIYPVYKVSIKAAIYPSVALVVYFLFPNFYLESLSTIRNSVAFSLVLYAFYLYYFQKSRISKFFSFLVLLLAIGFHASAIVGFLIYPLSHIRIGRITNVIIWLSSFFVGALVSSFLAQYVGGFTDASRLIAHMENATTGGQSLTYAVNLLAIIHFIFWRRLVHNNSNNELYLTFFNIGICLWNVFLFVDSTLALRLSSFYTIFIVLLYSNTNVLVRYINKPLRNVLISYFLVLFVLLMAAQIRGYVNHNIRMGMIPYQTIFAPTYYPNYY